MLTLAVLILIAFVFTVYTVSAYYVASHVGEWYGRLWWPDTAGGSFYPWPHMHTGLAGFLITELDQADAQYYIYVIKSGVLIILTLVFWGIALWRVWKFSKYRIKSP